MNDKVFTAKDFGDFIMQIDAYISAADVIDFTWYDSNGNRVETTDDFEYDMDPLVGVMIEFKWTYNGKPHTLQITEQDCMDAEIVYSTIRFKGKCALDMFKITPYFFSERV